MTYFRPLVQHGVARPSGALPLVGGGFWFTHAEVLERNALARVVSVDAVPQPVLERLAGARKGIAGLEWDQPRIMGILNVTPDSFSDGGRHDAPDAALRAATGMIDAGADIVDIGGESTRPGAVVVSAHDEVARVAPVIAALREQSEVPISVDTRKAEVGLAALQAGASLVNDVSGFTYDAALAPLCAKGGVPVCIMHAQGDPVTMQDSPVYDNVALDVYDFLEARIVALENIGIPRARILVDPGIGFGKTLAHNLAILQNISLFHGLGCVILLGVSRKGFIGRIGNAERADARAPGSIAVGLAALAQGVQMLRVHDVAQTAQAMALWRAVRD